MPKSSIENTIDTPESSRAARIRVIDESLLTGMAKPGRLFCTVDTGFVSLSVADADRNKFYGLEVFPFSKTQGDSQRIEMINNLASESQLLRKVDFRNVSVQLSTTSFTFIPEALFRKEDAGSYYYFNQPQRQDEVIVFDEIRSIGAVNIFSVPELLLSALKKQFENFSLHHHLTSLLESTRYAASGSSDKVVFVHMHSALIDVIVMADRKLLFANSYSYKSSEDAAYYLLMVLNQLAVNPEKAEVVMTGEVEDHSGTVTLFRNYLRNLRIGNRTKAAEFTYGFDQLPSHYYHLSFSHILCAS